MVERQDQEPTPPADQDQAQLYPAAVHVRRVFVRAVAGYGRLAGIAVIPDGVVGLSAACDDWRKRREHIRTKHGTVAKRAHGSQYRQSQNGHCEDETAPPAQEIIVVMTRAVTSANRSGLDICVVAVIDRGWQE